ncbi:MAG TPA: hypothetical protein VF590_13540, partial [Isosphaeraceae bacterium]
PWWSYASRPDLRWHRHLRGLGGRYVRIELEKPAGQVLCFLAWAWDTIFDVEYLSASPTEARRWGRRMRRSVPDEDAWPLPEPWQSELVASWERLFDPRLPLRPELRGRGWTEDVEAVFETLDLADVRAVTPFVGARRY